MLLALLAGEEERDGTKIGDEEQDIARDKSASSCSKGQRCWVWNLKYCKMGLLSKIWKIRLRLGW